MRPVPGGTVYLVPASDVRSAFANRDRSLRVSRRPRCARQRRADRGLARYDQRRFLRARPPSTTRACIDSRRFLTESFGYFIVWVPAAGDAEHLPGGDSSSVSFDTASLVGMQMDIRVSSQPSESATYVGSSTCMVCHGLHSTTRTAHNVGLQVPGVRSICRTSSPGRTSTKASSCVRQTDDTLFYFDCVDTAAGFSRCEGFSVSTTDPTDPGPPEVVVSFEMRLEVRRSRHTARGRRSLFCRRCSTASRRAGDRRSYEVDAHVRRRALWASSNT